MSKNKKQRELSEQEVNEGIDGILKRYAKKIGKKDDPQVFHINTKTNSQSEKENKEIGDIWKEGDYWIEKKGESTFSRSRQHPDVWKERGKIVDSINRPTCECGKSIKNENELKVFRSRGKCLTCLAEEETEAIADKKPYIQRKITKKDMIIKDTMGNPVMSVAELEEELGKELTAEEINKLSKKNQQ